jgi:hypothetical protein
MKIKNIALARTTWYSLVGCVAVLLGFHFQFLVLSSIFASIYTGLFLTFVLDGFKVGSIVWATTKRHEHPVADRAIWVIRLIAVLFSVFCILFHTSTTMTLPNADGVRARDLEALESRYNQNIAAAESKFEAELSTTREQAETTLRALEAAYNTEVSRWDDQIILETDIVVNGAFDGKRYRSWELLKREAIERHESSRRELRRQEQESRADASRRHRNEIEGIRSEFLATAERVRTSSYADDPRAQHLGLWSFVTSIKAVFGLDLSPTLVGWVIAITISLLLEAIILIVFFHLSMHVAARIQTFDAFREQIIETGRYAAEEVAKEGGDHIKRAARPRHASEKIREELNYVVEELLD